MEKIKAIYTFNVNLVKEVEENGEKVKKITTYPFAIRKPSRSEKEEADLIRSEYLNKYLTRGVLSEDILNRIHEDQGGTVTENEQAYFGILQIKLKNVLEDLKLATIEKNKEKEAEFLDEVTAIQREITELQYKKSLKFQVTAEFKSKSKLCEYLFATLTYWKPTEDKEWEPYFKQSSSFDDMLNDIDRLEDEEDEIYLKMKDQAMLAVSVFVHSGGNIKPEDISKSVKENLGDE